ncbi:MAG: UDP-phosphate alpha-N-acetylglucosaminyl 1-phosphate transferase, partial [Xanthomonadales bacterium]|nr:UDP-phosphate alpha-N-acetylglucosaminyl 1-phosphate transferase [Xanthomonadales bacterium]
ALWFFAVPLFDTVFLMIQRKLAGKSMVEADRRHLHHAFLRSGRSVNVTLLAMVLLAALMAGAGLAMEVLAVPEYWRFYAFLLVSGVYYLAMSRSWRSKRFFGRLIQ